MNPSGLQPVGRAVLLKPYTVEEKVGSIVLAHSVVVKDQLAEQRAVVVEVGPTCWHTEPIPRCKAGDKVLFSKWAGYQAIGTLDGETYRIVNDNDIFMLITQEKEVNHG